VAGTHRFAGTHCLCHLALGDDGSTATVMLAANPMSAAAVVVIDMTGSPSDLAEAARKDCPASPTHCVAQHCSRRRSTRIACPAPMSPPGHRRPPCHARCRPLVDDRRRAGRRSGTLWNAPGQCRERPRLSRNGAHDHSPAPKPDEQELVEIMAAFEKVGYSDLVLMSGGGNKQRKAAERSAA
jgi:hypothetical protein